MNRVIKFRAWSLDAERMIEAPYRFEQNAEGNTQCYEDWRDLENGIYHQCILMQFIDMLDQNSKEVYEGDLLQWGKNIVVVEWVDGGFCYRLANGQPINRSMGDQIYFYLNPASAEIIGNIYENPELIA